MADTPLPLLNIQARIPEILSMITAKGTIQNALDMGCGRGRFAILLAQAGVSVTGVDIHNPSIIMSGFTFINANLETFSFPTNYDAILASFVLHFLSRVAAEKIIIEMQEATTSGGYNLLVCMSNQEQGARTERFYPSREELERRYDSWEVLLSEEGITPEEEHDNLSPHSHCIALLLARKI